MGPKTVKTTWMKFEPIMTPKAYTETKGRLKAVRMHQYSIGFKKLVSTNLFMKKSFTILHILKKKHI